MDLGQIAGLMRSGIWQVLVLIFPVLSAALVVGLFVAVFQATTSINEQTLTFLPKMVTILIVLALLGGWMFATLRDWTTMLFSEIPNL